MNTLLAGQRMLVVEDEMLVLLNLEDLLADLGCDHVVSAATVAQAIRLIDSQTFDLAILDVNLNGNPSYPIADALSALGVPFAFSTGYADHGFGIGYG